MASGRPRADTNNREKTELTTEQMFDIMTLGSLPGVILILLNRPINIYPGIGGVNDNGAGRIYKGWI